MCNHYSSSGEWRDRMGEFSHLKIPPFRDRGALNSVAAHVYPGKDGEILMAVEGELTNAAAHWRFVPPTWKGTLAEWGKASNPAKKVFRGKGLNNAKGETADTIKTFRDAAQSGRCVIPVEAFFEYGDDGHQHPEGGGRIEYRFTPAAGGVLWLAGLWGWADPVEGRTLTFTMVTKEKGAETGSIGHHRQPMNLGMDEIEAWLDYSNPVKAFTGTSPAGTFKVEACPPRPRSSGKVKDEVVTDHVGAPPEPT